ncbi:MAG TPA: LuxR C-terminal-related transcriptional regulator [Gemmatimonadales bacterium]
MIRVWVAVRDPDRRAALIRALRSEASVRLVGSEAEADIVCREAEPVSLPLALPLLAGERLTPREREVLRLVAEGLDNRMIGRQLGITRSTVKHHLEAVYAKLGVHGRMEAVREGVRRGLVPL